MKKIYARNCIVQQINESEAKDFLLINHKQKYARAKVYYGLFYNDELVQLMSFGKPRFNKNYQWEIIRDCSKKNCQIIGGASKLWKFFLKNNGCHSCICYSYPHDIENLFTEKYIKHCNFKNIQKAKPDKKIYFEGVWNGELKRIDKTILEKHGVDRLLKTKQGQDRTNEQILLDLGFEKKFEDGFTPQVDIWYPFSVVYRIDDLDDGKFYVGISENEQSWNNGYLGSGDLWSRHLNSHPNKSLHKNRRNKEAHLYKRTILYQNLKTPAITRDLEIKEIKKFFKKENGKWIKIDPLCQNLSLRRQLSGYTPPVCPECGGRKGRHYATCSEYKKLEKCPECGSAYGQHKTTCSHYNEIICSECGGKHGNHKKTCSQCKQQSACPECGVEGGSHKKTCSRAKKCQYCGTPMGGFHKKDCPLYEDKQSCSECGGKNGTHKKGCSFYKERKVCKICGRTRHLKGCPNSTQVLKENKEINKCSECGFYYGKHSDNCSKNIITPEICPECGGKHYQHKKDCSKNKNICPECGKTRGNHEDWCSKAIICSECQGRHGRHREGCSKIKKCQECGTINNVHKKVA